MIRFESRAWSPLALAATAPIIAALGAVLIVAGACVLLTPPTISATSTIIATLGSAATWSNVLARSAPLMLAGLATAFAFRVGLINLGAEGQLFAGALAALAVGSVHLPVSADVLLGLALFVGMVAGALMMALPTALNIVRGIDEATSTLLLNAMAMAGVESLLTAAQPEIFVSFGSGTRLVIGLTAGTAACVIIHLLMRVTVFGFKLRAIGGNAVAARNAGIHVDKLKMGAGVMSGALCGLAGAGMVGGLIADVTTPPVGLGYAAITVAVLAAEAPLAIIPASFFVAAVTIVIEATSRSSGFPAIIAEGVLAVALLLTLVASTLVRYRMCVVVPGGTPI